MKRLKLLFIVPIFSAVLFGCQPTPNVEDLNANLVVQTEYEPSANFGSYATYTLPLDTLGFISNNSSDTLIVDDYASLITSKIKSNMDSRGYTYTDKDQDPDLGVSAFIVNDFNVFQTISYPTYGGGYYSSYYGYYYPIVNTYASNSAILIIQLVDLKKKDSQNRFVVLWSVYAGDILASPDPFNQSGEAVDQAFIQTPVIGK